MYTPDQLKELMSVSNYVVMSTPYTPQTDKVRGFMFIVAMKAI
jgi:phosphoglycerate dehydrogenase-like enzyme